MIAKAAVSCTDVAKDLSQIDENTADEIATELNESQEDPVFESFIQQANNASIAQLVEEKKKIKALVEECQKKIRFITYFEHVNSDIKSNAVQLSDVLFEIARGSI